MNGIALLIFCILQRSVVTQLRCCGKYNTSLCGNLLQSPTVQELLKEANLLQRDRATLCVIEYFAKSLQVTLMSGACVSSY